MKTIDRLILGALVVGMWTLITIQVTAHTPAYAASVDASVVDDLVYVIQSTVEDCYVYGEADSGEIDGYISC
jgi:hypothetical protein